ncbi:hypothetical protein Tco_1351395 [Tanacetum coccineum]
MNTTQAQQKALDDALVAPADRLEFEKCNMRLKTDIKPKEATFQVVLDALALTPFYQAFLITAKVPAIYMQEFWATVSVHKSSIKFMINKKKVTLDVEIFIEILKFCPKIPGQEFEDLLLEHDILSFIRDLRHSGDIIYLSDIENKDAKKTNKMSYPRFTKIITGYFMSKDQSISRRNKMFWHTAQDDTMFTSIRCISRHEDTQVYADTDTSPKPKPVQATKGTRLKTKAKVAKSDNSHASGSGDGVDTQSKVPDEQLQMTSGTDEGTGTKPGVPDVPKYDSESKKESWGDSDEDDEDDLADDADDNDDDSDDSDDSDDKMMDEEAKDEVTKELYTDVNVNLGNEDAEMTNADQGGAEQQNVSQDSGFEQVEEDAHVTLITIHDTQKTARTEHSSFVSYDFTSKLLNLDNTPPLLDESSSQTSSMFTVPVTAVPEITSAITVPPPHPSFNPLQHKATPTPTPITSEETTSTPTLPDFAFVFKFNERVTNLEKDLSEMKQVDQYAKALFSIPAIVDHYMDNKLGEAINKAILAHNLDCRQEAHDEKNEYIRLFDTTIRTIIKEEVITQLPQAVSDFATPEIEKNVAESLEAAVLTRSLSQP